MGSFRYVCSMSRVLKHYRTYNGRYNPADIHPLTPFPAERKEPIRSLTDSRLTDKALLSSAALWYTFEAMSALNRPEEEADWQQFESMKRIAWKTGTSYGGRDAWAIGTTPRYVVGVWQVTLPARAVRDLRVSATPPRSFSISFPYCPVANGSTCPTMRRFPWRSAGTAGIKPRPTASKRTPYTCRCPAITRGFAPTISSCIYRRTDGTGSIVPASLSTDDQPPVVRASSRAGVLLPQLSHRYIPLPPVKPGCGQDLNRQIELIYPEHNAILYLPKGFSGKSEKFIFKAAHARRDATIYWHLDESYLGETTENHQISCSVSQGKHLLTLIDNEGNQKKIQFEVK